MDINSLISILIGGTFGLTLRMFIQNNFKIETGFFIKSTTLINFLASFFLGILVALNLTNKNLFLLIYSGFLGSFSTFSSFIYHLFILFKQGKFKLLCFHYVEVMFISFLSFYFGHYLVEIF